MSLILWITSKMLLTSLQATMSTAKHLYVYTTVTTYSLTLFPFCSSSIYPTNRANRAQRIFQHPPHSTSAMCRWYLAFLRLGKFAGFA